MLWTMDASGWIAGEQSRMNRIQMLWHWKKFYWYYSQVPIVQRSKRLKYPWSPGFLQDGDYSPVHLWIEPEVVFSNCGLFSYHNCSAMHISCIFFLLWIEPEWILSTMSTSRPLLVFFTFSVFRIVCRSRELLQWYVSVWTISSTLVVSRVV